MGSLQGSTYGHLQLLWMRHFLRALCVHALKLTPPTLDVCLPSLEMTTSATPAVVEDMRSGGFIQRTLCGTERGVVQPARVVSSTLLHGSVKNSLNQPLMMWKYECVDMTLTGALHLSLLNYIYNERVYS